MSSATADAINASTRFCAVYGHPIEHSASPAMQNAGLAALGLNWRYLAFDVHPNDLRTALAGAMRMKFVGLNLTVPHKLLAVELMDQLDVSAQKWGAVNTVRFEAQGASGSWQPVSEVAPGAIRELRSVGFNTDADAIVRALREDLGCTLRGQSVLLLGAGGAGRVAALRLAEEGASPIYLVNRTLSKAEALRREIQTRFAGVIVQVGYPSGQIDLVVNATSLGLKSGDPLPFETAEFPLSATAAVYDMIYRPAETPLLQLAKAAGCRCGNGLGMLLYQGAKALEIWTGRPAAVDAMKRALEDNVYGR